MEESIENLDASAPPFNDQVTVSSAVNVRTVVWFSLTVLVLVAAPALPVLPWIKGFVSSTLVTETVTVWSEVLLPLSVALTPTT